MTLRPMVLLEFNELCPGLMRRFMAEGHLPSFSRLHQESIVAGTVADEVAPHLDPWIQWITVHSGVPFREHGIHDLGEGHRLSAPNLWDLASAAGGSAFVCGSMNPNLQPGFRGWFIPDPWATRIPPRPAELAPYFRFVQAHVTEYTAGKVPLGPGDVLAFARFMATHGLSARTVGALVRQLAGERLDPPSRWRRAALLDQLQRDLFLHVWRRERPTFSTFFLNSTAHFQHLYWRHFEPERFKIVPPPEELARYRDAILYGYRQMDRIVGDFLELAGDDVDLVFATAFSQQPFLAYEDRGGKVPYRPRDFARFLARLGIEGRAAAAPVMTHQFHLDFAGEAEARAAEERLAALTWLGQPVMSVKRDGARILAGCQVYAKVPGDASVLQGERAIPFYDLFYAIDLVKSGMHHPEGMLWMRTRERVHRQIEGLVPLVDVAPTLCRLIGLEVPATMRGTPLDGLPARKAA